VISWECKEGNGKIVTITPAISQSPALWSIFCAKATVQQNDEMEAVALRSCEPVARPSLMIPTRI
jgi:hypothetical protein